MASRQPGSPDGRPAGFGARADATHSLGLPFGASPDERADAIERYHESQRPPRQPRSKRAAAAQARLRQADDALYDRGIHAMGALKLGAAWLATFAVEAFVAPNLLHQIQTGYVWNMDHLGNTLIETGLVLGSPVAALLYTGRVSHAATYAPADPSAEARAKRLGGAARAEAMHTAQVARDAEKERLRLLELNQQQEAIRQAAKTAAANAVIAERARIAEADRIARERVAAAKDNVIIVPPAQQPGRNHK